MDANSTPGEQRTDLSLREIFVDAWNTVEPYMMDDGGWLSMAHECLAHEALARQFPELSGERMFAVVATIANVRGSGRRPTA